MVTATSLKDALLIDFTGSVSGFEKATAFDSTIVSKLRHAGVKNKTLVIIDKGTGFQSEGDHVVSDHLNLTGSNPLTGPNDPIGERFPVVADLYITDALKDIPQGIVAGLKPGIVPSPEELKRIYELGGSFCSYNLVQTALIAAHAGWKILAIVTPGKLAQSTMDQLNSYIK